jgi:hypothetical protein
MKTSLHFNRKSSLKQKLLFCAMIIFVFMTSIKTAYSQNGVLIAPTTGTADNSAILDVSSSTQGLLIPRLTETQKLAIQSPATGLLIFQYDGTQPGFYYNSGLPLAPVWTLMGGSGGGGTAYKKTGFFTSDGY